jgi:hypothetical protein
MYNIFLTLTVSLVIIQARSVLLLFCRLLLVFYSYYLANVIFLTLYRVMNME